MLVGMSLVAFSSEYSSVFRQRMIHEGAFFVVVGGSGAGVQATKGHTIAQKG